MVLITSWRRCIQAVKMKMAPDVIHTLILLWKSAQMLTWLRRWIIHFAKDQKIFTGSDGMQSLRLSSQYGKQEHMGNNAVQTWHYIRHFQHFPASACYTAQLAFLIYSSTTCCTVCINNVLQSDWKHGSSLLLYTCHFVFWPSKLHMGTFVIWSSTSVTGSVNSVLLMMLYWSPNWITKQHSIMIAQSIHQAVACRQICFVFSWV